MSLKKIIRKSTASFVAMLVIHSNCYMFGLGLSAVVAQDIKEPDINLSMENMQYVQFKEEIIVNEVETEQEQPVSETQEQIASQTEVQANNETTESEKQYYSGVAIKTKLLLALEEQEANLPIKSSEVVVSMPVLNNCLPERASVAKANTVLTTGENNNQKINQNYDSNSGLLTISYENEDTYSKYNKESKDEFEIIYIYPAQAYTGNEEEISLQYSVVAKVNFQTENANTTSEKMQGFELKEKENKGTLLTFGVTNLESDIYKGFMYANVENGFGYNTDYNTVSTMCVLDKNATNEITMAMEENKFVLNDKQNTEISSEGKVLYKSTQVSKTEFDKILGQEGNIEIYSNENKIATIKYVDVNENEEIVKRLAIIYSEENIKILSSEETIAKIEFGEGITNITITTTKPVSEGYMNFKNENTIISSENYIVNVSRLKSIKTTSVINNNTTNVELLLLEPKTKITVNSSNTNFSTLQTSKTTLTINLDSTNSSTKLFNNPTISIELPEGLKNGKLSSPEIVNGNGLTIKSATASNNLITIQLEGKQTKHDLTNVSGGASIVMDLENIEFDNTMPTHEDNITVTCIQNNEHIKANKQVNLVSKAGLLVLSNITGLDDNQTITSIDSETRTVEIKNNEQQRQIEQTINLVNNYDANLTNTQIIGKIGCTNNNELNSTFDLELLKPIEVNNAKVYYSTNKDATFGDESWTEEFTYQAKAYKIELNNLELASKTATQIKLYFKAQANIGYNQKTYVRTEINYTYNEQNLNDSSTFGITTPENNLAVQGTATNVELTNEQGTQIPVNVTITPSISLPYVHSKQRVTYIVKVTNNGTQDLNNIVVEDIIPDNAIYTYLKVVNGGMADINEIAKDEQLKNKTWNIETLKSGETKEFEIMLTMADVSEEQEITNTVTLKCNNQNITTQNKLTLKPTKIEANLVTNTEEIIGIEYNKGSEIVYLVKIKNTTEETLKNVNTQFEFPETLAYIEGGLASYHEIDGYSIKEQGTINNNILEYNIKKLKSGEESVIYVKAKVNKLAEGHEADITTIAKIITEDDIYETNINTVTTKQSDFNIKLTSNIEENQTLKKGDEVIYKIEVENVGAVPGSTVIKDTIPEQLNVYQIEEYVNGELNYALPTATQNIEWITSHLEKGEKSTLIITTEVDNIELEDVQNIETANKAVVEFGYSEITSNEEKIVIQPEQKTEDVGYIPYDLLKVDVEKENSSNQNTNTSNSQNNTDEKNNTETNQNQQQSTETSQNQNQNQQQSTETSQNQNQQQGTGTNQNQQQNIGTNQNVNQDSNNEQNQEQKTYSISGNVWLDLDKNGAKDETETLQQNITVTLINMATRNFATDQNGNKIITTTDSQGKYSFNNIAEGLYAVMFELDTQNYTVTTYQKDGVEQNSNSDAILSNVNINGEDKTVALTDKIQLTENKENINLGLIENAIFDLSLNKQITKITIVNKKGTESYEYNDGHTAKVELEDKYMSGSEVIVNYKFTIKNEGEVIGYVNNLMDSLPSGLEFNSELNTNWYKDSDGNLYTTSFAGKALKPGESIDIDLVLTKTMTEENAGTFVNNAKLEKISNLENIQEKEQAQENNQSSAILIISLKTGSIILYIGITAICLAIIGTGAYVIKKKVLIERI